MTAKTEENNEKEGTIKDIHDQMQRPVDTVIVHPTEKLSISVSGEEYIKYRALSERIVFSEKMTTREKNGRILRLALDLLEKQVETMKLTKGASFFTEEEIRRF